MKTKVGKFANLGLKTAIVVFTFAFVYKQILERHDLDQWLHLWKGMMAQPLSQMLLVFNLMLLATNILIESFKWQFLIGKLEQIKLHQAIVAVFTSLSVSMFLPNRVGDYLSRVFVLKKASHLKGILATLIGSLAQIIVTFLAGIIGFLVVFPTLYPLNSLNMWLLFLGLVVAAMLFGTMLLLMYFNVGLLKWIVSPLAKKRKDKLLEYLEVFSWYSSTDLIKVLLYSLLRYGVYSSQFYLMLRTFDLNISYPQAMALIAIVYLMITIIPTIAIAELGVRGSVSIAVFSIYLEKIGALTPEAPIAVLAASSAIWLLNLAFPAVVGAVLSYRLKFFRKGLDDV